MPLIFDADHLQDTTNECVCWIDIMGIQSMMSRSLKIASSFMCKVHIAALTNLRAGIRIYPVMDGFYASSPNQNSMIGFMKDVFRELASEFINQDRIYYRFVVKGALAFGPVLHGEEIPRQVSHDLFNNTNYKKISFAWPPNGTSMSIRKKIPTIWHICS